MPAKEWVVPLVLAAVTFAGLSQLDLHPGAGRDASSSGGQAPPAAGIVQVFGQPVVGQDNATVTRILLSTAGEGIDASFAWGTRDWRTRHVAFEHVRGEPLDCDAGSGAGSARMHPDADTDDPSAPCWVRFPVAPPEAPRLGMAGHNATRVTVHVFNAQGELVFSNGDEAEQARLVRRHQPEQLPDGVWYLGANETAPNGTRRLPAAAAAFLDGVRPLLDGLPEGGVASVETEALRTWYGTLYVTLRVDELVHAP